MNDKEVKIPRCQCCIGYITAHFTGSGTGVNAIQVRNLRANWGFLVLLVRAACGSNQIIFAISSVIITFLVVKSPAWCHHHKLFPIPQTVLCVSLVASSPLSKFLKKILGHIAKLCISCSDKDYTSKHASIYVFPDCFSFYVLSLT